MNNSMITPITNFISKYLLENTNVIDICCGDDAISKWIEKENRANLISLSPENLEHISHENPFVAYNNFVNDSRMLPIRGNLADVVLLTGPLYNLQSNSCKMETLKEAKRLLNTDGKLITLRNYGESQFEDDNKNSIEEDFLSDAGFDIGHTAQIQESTVDSEQGNYYLTVATPKSAISEFDVPPEVFINIPDDRIKEHNITLVKDNKHSIKGDISQKAEGKNTKNIADYYSHIEIKPSIDSTLNSKKSAEKMPFYNDKAVKLPILPKVILEQYGEKSLKEDNSSKENILKENDNLNIEKHKDEQEENLSVVESEDTSRAVKIPIKQSIDKNLVVRTNKNEIVSNRAKIARLAEVHPSIDKSLQMRLPKINPMYAKKKSRKKGTKNLIK